MGRGKKRRPKGTGKISEYADGRVGVSITLDTLAGKRTFRSTVRSKKEAERWIKKTRKEYEGTDLNPDSRTLTVAAFFPLWLESIEDTVSRHTYRDYADKARLHIIPHHGHIRLKDLTTPHINALYREMVKIGKSPTLIRYVHATYRKALHDAEGWDLVRKNVARFARPPKIVHEEKPVMSREEATRFLEVIRGDRLEAVCLLAVVTGLRRGEILGLKWSDLDLSDESASLKVSRSLDSYYGPTEEKDTKRASSRRPAVLPGPIAEALRRHRKNQLEEKVRAGPAWQENGYVFPTTLGTPQRGDNVLARGLKSLMERAGLPEGARNFQYLRRSAATFLVLLKIHPRVAMRWLGHSDISTTMKFYAQAPDELQEEAARMMGEFFFGGGKEPENGS